MIDQESNLLCLYYSIQALRKLSFLHNFLYIQLKVGQNKYFFQLKSSNNQDYRLLTIESG